MRWHEFDPGELAVMREHVGLTFDELAMQGGDLVAARDDDVPRRPVSRAGYAAPVVLVPEVYAWRSGRSAGPPGWTPHDGRP